jgi:hypothetical protein
MKGWDGSTDGGRPRQPTGVAEVLGAGWAAPHLGRRLATLPTVGTATHVQMMNMNSQCVLTGDCNCCNVNCMEGIDRLTIQAQPPPSQLSFESSSQTVQISLPFA